MDVRKHKLLHFKCFNCSQLRARPITSDKVLYRNQRKQNDSICSSLKASRIERFNGRTKIHFFNTVVNSDTESAELQSSVEC